MERAYGTGVGQGTFGERMREEILRQFGAGLYAGRGVASVQKVPQRGGRLRLPCASRPRVHPA